MLKVRRVKRKLRRKMRKNWGKLTLFLVGVILGLSIGLAIAASSQSTSQESKWKSQNVTVEKEELSGEFIFKNICMRCHTSPTKFKSFTTYFGKPAEVWRIGVQKMIATGNVRLTENEVKSVTEYLEKRFGK
jgi:hypothetical protein